jgi:hypothetical protein
MTDYSGLSLTSALLFRRFSILCKFTSAPFSHSHRLLFLSQLFFESFPIVFGEIYHFNLGQQGLAFLAYFVTGIITFIGYCLYQKYHITPLYQNGNEPAPEVRLDLALYVSVMIPISTFFFGESRRADRS